MTKEYVRRLREIAQAQLVDEVGRDGVRFFDQVNMLGLHDELAHILATAVAAEINGAGQYPTLKRFVDDCVQENVETMAIDDAREFMRSL